jgi:hypothetical protein
MFSGHLRNFGGKPLLWRRFVPPRRGLVKLNTPALVSLDIVLSLERKTSSFGQQHS